MAKPRAVKQNWTPDQPLPNERWELWVCKVLSGMSRNEAAAECGYNVKYTATLIKNQQIKGRMLWLQEQAAEKVQVTQGWWLREMHAIASSDLTDVMRWTNKPQPAGFTGPVDLPDDDEGDVPGAVPNEEESLRVMPAVEVTPSDELPDRVRQALKKVKISYNSLTESVDLECQMHDKMAALKILGEYLGLIGKDARQRKPVEGVVREMEVDDGRGLTNDDLEAIRRVAWPSS